ncbi:unnamed protein product, partial [Timema podura]|nr:unnamed protein product [Timema podura]
FQLPPQTRLLVPTCISGESRRESLSRSSCKNDRSAGHLSGAQMRRYAPAASTTMCYFMRMPTLSLKCTRSMARGWETSVWHQAHHRTIFSVISLVSFNLQFSQL